MKRGYIKLFRKMLDWEWYDDIPVKTLFFHCLLKVNYNDGNFKGKLIKNGSFITSYPKLAQETGLTIDQTRRAINKLKTTGEITHETTRQYSIISVNNWALWQSEPQTNDQTNTSQTPDKRPDKQQQSKKKKKEKKEKKINISSSSSINVQAKSKQVQNEINLTEEEEELLKNLSKRNGVKYFDLWLEKLVKNGHLQKRLQEEKEKAARKRAIEARFLEEKEQEEQVPEMSAEEREAFLQKMREKAGVSNRRKGEKQNGKNSSKRK